MYHRFLSILLVFLLILLEIAIVYFIMPLPGSQESNSLNLAYFLYSNRWFFRIGLGIFATYFIFKSGKKRKWILIFLLALYTMVIYLFNFQMTAEKMFYQPQSLDFKKKDGSTVDTSRLIIGIEFNREAVAYPIQYIGYHHQVYDKLGCKDILVTYCTVCRSGRVFEPLVRGKKEKFRLVGMDHFNALLEDQTTKSWWQQATGEAVAGELKGLSLKEVYSRQMRLGAWLRMYPNSKIMQADPHYIEEYDQLSSYELGGKGSLTGTDKHSWKPKSWILGIIHEDNSLAIDWNTFCRKKFIKFELGSVAIVSILNSDGKSFAAYLLPNKHVDVHYENDQIILGEDKYRFDGHHMTKPSKKLISVKAYQEFWLSWKTFHPKTEVLN